jgi:predicted dehydrogenase
MTVARPVRVGLIGCGFYAQNHLNAWSDLKPDGADLVAVCDLDAAKAEAAGRKFGAQWFTDAGQMLDRMNIDLLDIATQMHSHRALGALAAERGIAAILQKPLAPTLGECEEIVATADRHGTWLAVHENFRFETPMRRVKARLEAGDIGLPNWARISFRTGYDVYAGQPYLMTEDRLSIIDSGIHVLDLARWFMGEVDYLTCETQRRNPKIKAEDTATILLRHTSGAVSVVETTYEAHRTPDPFPETLLEIEGTEGSVIVTPGEQMTLTSRGKATTEFIGAPLLSWTARPWHVSQEAVLHTCSHMLASFRAGKPAETDGADSLKTFSLVEAAYRSAETHTSVRPKFN